MKVAYDFLSRPLNLNLAEQLHLAVRVVVYQIELGESITNRNEEKMDIGGQLAISLILTKLYISRLHFLL